MTEKANIPITARTASYHAKRIFEENPQIPAILANKAREMRGRGQRVSITALFEWARLEHYELSKHDPFKVNNNLKAAFSRELMERYPDLQGVFETRKAIVDDAYDKQ